MTDASLKRVSESRSPRPSGEVDSTRKSIFFPIITSGSVSPLVRTMPSSASGNASSSPGMLISSVGARTISSALLGLGTGTIVTVSSMPTPMLFLV